MSYFLLVYDRPSGEVLLTEFNDAARDAALEARLTAEVDSQMKNDVEVVLLRSASLDSLKETHSRFFADELRLRVESLA